MATKPWVTKVNVSASDRSKPPMRSRLRYTAMNTEARMNPKTVLVKTPPKVAAR
jgi:hypothetical protein